MPRVAEVTGVQIRHNRAECPEFECGSRDDDHSCALGAQRHRADEAANLLFGVRCMVMRYPNAVEEDVWILR